MKGNILHITVCLSTLWWASCSKEVSQEELIASAVALKLEQWQKEEMGRCRERALMDAEKFVDSLMVAMSLDAKLDTIPKPGKPVKPEKPVFREKPDSVVVKELLREEQ